MPSVKNDTLLKGCIQASFYQHASAHPEHFNSSLRYLKILIHFFESTFFLCHCRNFNHLSPLQAQCRFRATEPSAPHAGQPPAKAAASSVYPAAPSSLGRLCGTNTYEQKAQTPFRIDFNFSLFIPDLQSRLLTLGKAQTNLALLSLNRSLHFSLPVSLPPHAPQTAPPCIQRLHSPSPTTPPYATHS